MLKRFPTMPPFGPDWFGVLSEVGHPVAELRLDWILENVAQDAADQAKQQCDAVEYGGFFANPRLYEAVKQARKDAAELRTDGAASSTSAGPLKVVFDDSDYHRRLAQIEAGGEFDGKIDLTIDAESLAFLRDVEQRMAERGKLAIEQAEGPILDDEARARLDEENDQYEVEDWLRSIPDPPEE